jgi:hypothetical protein
MPARLVALLAGVVTLAACGARPSLGQPAQTVTAPSTTVTTAAPATPATTAAAPTTTVTDPATTDPGTTVAATIPVPDPTPPTVAATAPTTPAPVAVAGGLYLLGDSVMLGARDALQRYFPGAVVDAVESRSFIAGVDVARHEAATGALGANVVVHLGANGAITPQECDQMMDTLGGRHVVLLTIKVPRPWEAPNNAVLQDCASRRGATLADWQAVAVANPGALYKDGIHLRPPAGGLLYTQLVAQSL